MTNYSNIYRGTEYASYRPEYPEGLIRWLCSLPESKQHAWDCGTGNGQVARKLAGYFEHVTATDSNHEQIQKCSMLRNIRYAVEHAEKSSLPDKSIDLVTVGCAVHWFDTEKFYAEVSRVLKPGGMIAVWCYEYPWTGNHEVDEILRHYKEDILGNFWPPEAQIYFNRYQNLQFPFEGIRAQIPTFEIDCQWGPSEVLNFLSTWTGPIKYKNETGHDPKLCIEKELSKAWSAAGLNVGVKLPIYMKVGKL
jgi:SAM-dependent methyltransferase